MADKISATIANYAQFRNLTSIGVEEFKTQVMHANYVYTCGDVCGGMLEYGTALINLAQSLGVDNGPSMDNFFDAASAAIGELRMTNSLAGKFPNARKVDWNFYLIMKTYDVYANAPEKEKIGISFDEFFRGSIMTHYDGIADVNEFAGNFSDEVSGMIKSKLLSPEQIASLRTVLVTTHSMLEYIAPQANQKIPGVIKFDLIFKDNRSVLEQSNPDCMDTVKCLIANVMAFFVSINMGIIPYDYFEAPDNQGIFGPWEYYLHPGKIAMRLHSFRAIRLSHEILEKAIAESEQEDVQEKDEDSIDHQAFFYC